MKMNEVERDRRIADFKEVFDAEVTIQKFGGHKNLYFLSNRTGLSYAIPMGDLLKKSVLSVKSFGLTNMVMPTMNESEYNQFIQELVKRSTTIGKQ